ncbi:MAG: adenosylcobinamide-GDP ribazoletransferase [Proteobacteria bacterium]|nr:adenosylcobinamide-GDP ribazoletransferase [Pseudomonadota bacterium]MBU1456073.1 adenosylcobinamide-GDP ribazoletransferase [Pseudomonadota bacterium]
MGDDSTGQDIGLRLGLRFPLTSLLTALRFLTIFPISWRSKEDGRFFQASLVWFPLVGLLIGTMAAAVIFLSGSLLPPSLVAVLAIVFLAGISGCLHLDGLADSGDGLLSARPREQALDIMRDSRSGAMGVIVLIFVLLGKFAALSAMPINSMVMAVFFIPLAGRTAILLTMAVLPYARTGEGLGRLFYSADSRMLGLATLFFYAVVALFFSWKIAFLLLLAILATVALFSFWCFRKIGGATGDTLGAVCELTELATAVAFTVTF